MGPILRTAERADLVQLAALESRLFGASAYSPEALRQLWDLFRPLHFVAEDGDGHTTGYVLAALALGPEGRGWILALGVVPEARGQGLGVELVASAARALAAHGAREVRATVAPGNGASRAVLARAGFRQIDEDPDYFGPGAHRLVFALSLAPEAGR